MPSELHRTFKHWQVGTVNVRCQNSDVILSPGERGGGGMGGNKGDGPLGLRNTYLTHCTDCVQPYFAPFSGLNNKNAYPALYFICRNTPFPSK